MPRVTFTTKSMVCVHVKCTDRKVRALLRFLEETRIFPLTKMPGACGGGEYFSFFTAEDAARIEAWLIEQGAERKEEQKEI